MGGYFGVAKSGGGLHSGVGCRQWARHPSLHTATGYRLIRHRSIAGWPPGVRKRREGRAALGYRKREHTRPWHGAYHEDHPSGLLAGRALRAVWEPGPDTSPVGAARIEAAGSKTPEPLRAVLWRCVMSKDQDSLGKL